MFIPRSVLRYKLLFDAIALARTPVNLAQSLAQSRYLSTPLSLLSTSPRLPLCSLVLPYFTIISAEALRTADCHSL